MAGTTTSPRSSWARIVAASGPLRFLALVFALAALLLAAPPALRAINRGSFRAPVDEVRVPAFAVDATDEARAAATVGLRHRAVAWEAEWREEHESATVRPMATVATAAKHASALSTAVFDPTDEIALPTGATWRVLAIVAAANPSPEYGPGGSKDLEGDVFGADMRPLSAAEATELCERHQQDESELRRLPIDGHASVALKFWVEQFGEDQSGPVARFATDARTGWTIGDGNRGGNASYFGSRDGRRVILHQFPFMVAGWAAGPCVAWFDWRGEVLEELEIWPYPGFEIVHRGARIRLERVHERTPDGWTTYGSEGINPQRPYGITGAVLRQECSSAFLLFGVTSDYTSMVPYDAGGNALWSTFSMRSIQGTDNAFGFQTPLAEIDTLRLQYQPNFDRVGIRLPFVPGLPEGNRAIADFRDAVIPPLKIGGADGAVRALGHALQTTFGSGMGILNEPRLESPKTVGELLDAYRPDPSFAVVQHLDRTAGEHFTGFMLPGTVRGLYAPRRARIAGALLDPLGVANLAVAAMLVFAAIAAVQARRILQHMRARGYDAVRFRDAALLWLALGQRAWRVPHTEELGIIPGVDAASAASIVRFMAEARNLSRAAEGEE